jgi:hypothetical protein
MPIKMERLDFWAYFLSFLIRVLSDRKKKPPFSAEISRRLHELCYVQVLD